MTDNTEQLPPPTGWFWLENRIVEAIPTIGRLALAVYVVLARHADTSTRTCFPTVATLARTCRAAKRSVIRALVVLEQEGFISVERGRGDPGRPLPNMYHLLPQQPGDSRKPGGDTRKPGPVPSGPKPRFPGVQIPVPLGNRKETHKGDSTKEDNSARATNNKYPRDFDKWWEAYPRKVGKAKALQAWKRAVKSLGGGSDAREKLLEITKAFAGSPKGQAGRFCPHPSTWLSQARYEDEPADWEIDGQDNGRRTGAFDARQPTSGKRATF